MSSWHSTWSAMRGVTDRRNWWTWHEFEQGLRQAGLVISRYHVRQATKTRPPEMVRGVKRYDEHHARLAIEYAKVKGWIE
jgi:hypothetical protein